MLGAACALLFLATRIGQATGGGVIAFISHREDRNEIYLLDVATGQTRKLLPGSENIPLDEFSPLWSPDGQQLAFTAFFPSTDARITSAFNSEVMLLNTTGANIPYNLTRNTADREYLIGWSPDGQRLLFLSNRNWAFGRYGARDFTNLFVMDTDGSRVQQLGAFDLFNAQPRWSPDGSRIVFAAPGYIDSPDPLTDRDWDPEIFVINSDGSGLRQLTHNRESDGVPTWSPDGTQIAFMSPLLGDMDIYVVDAACVECSPQPLASGRLSEYFSADTSLVWSPDGRYLAAVLYNDGNPDIHRIEVATGEVRNLTEHPNTDQSPVWSPDGRRIAFTSNRDGNLEIYVMDVNGTHLRNLTRHQAVDYSPAWWPL
jgi:Tol biopolymer transport system component